MTSKLEMFPTPDLREMVDGLEIEHPELNADSMCHMCKGNGWIKEEEGDYVCQCVKRKAARVLLDRLEYQYRRIYA